jgi:hypothetical protein
MTLALRLDYDGDWFVTGIGPDLHIDRADPRVRISGELLEQIRAGNYHPAVTLDGDLLKIRAVNRTVIYRIGRQVDVHLEGQRGTYLAEWPD